MISIVTATYNKLELTQAFLDSLLAYCPSQPWEMVWVDDGSTDGTRDWLGTLPASRHRIIFNDKNSGYAASNNRGARLAQGEILIFLNNDLILTPGWLEPLIAALWSVPDIGMVGNVQISCASRLIDHAGVFFDLSGVPGHRLKNHPRGALRKCGVFSPAVTAACCAVKRDVFLNEGGFDEVYINGSEDFDLCLRLGRSGYRHWVDYRSVVWHHVSSSPGRKKHDLINQARFLTRWGELTASYGQRQWPGEYLTRVWRNPRQVNIIKFADALLRLLKLKRGDSAWAARKRAQLIAAGELNETVA